MPEVSVVLPVFNAETTIAQALRSVLQQTLQDLEVIVIDDGSTDGTPDVVKSIADTRVRYVRVNHRGVSAAANLGTELASSDMIARMDADDLCHPNRLALQCHTLAAEQLDVVGCKVEIRDRFGMSVPTMARYLRWQNEETMTSESIAALRFIEFPLVNPTLLARRAYFDIKFEDNSFPEDYHLMLTAAGQGMTFGKVPQPLLTWVDSDQRLTRTDQRYSSTAFMDCRRYHFRKDILSTKGPIRLWGAGVTGKAWLRWLIEIGQSVTKIVDVSPRRIGRQLHGIPIIAAEQLPPADGSILISAVGAMGAREKIRAYAMRLGYQQGVDLWFVA